MNSEDWDIIEEDCRCEYQGIRKGYCINSYTNKCDECRNNQLLSGKTESYYEIYL